MNRRASPSFRQPVVKIARGLSGSLTCEFSCYYECLVFYVQHHCYFILLDMPEGKPILRLEKSRYSSGDVLKGNCSSPPSNPPANITWHINGRTVNSSLVTQIRAGSKYETQASLEYEVPRQNQGKIKVVCIADFFQVYIAEAEQMIDEEKPQIASVLGGAGSSSYCSMVTNLTLFSLVLLSLTR